MLPAALRSFSLPAATEAAIDLFSAVADRPELHELTFDSAKEPLAGEESKR